VWKEFLAHQLSQRFVRLTNRATTLRRTPLQLATNMLRRVRTLQLQVNADVGVKVLRS